MENCCAKQLFLFLRSENKRNFTWKCLIRMNVNVVRIVSSILREWSAILSKINKINNLLFMAEERWRAIIFSGNIAVH